MGRDLERACFAADSVAWERSFRGGEGMRAKVGYSDDLTEV